MTLVPTVIVDNAEFTVTVDIDSVTGVRSNERLVYKPGTQGARTATIVANASQAITDITTARGLIAASGWDGLTANQRKLIMDGLLQDVSAIIRMGLNRFEATT